jgi:Na+/proline symporter
MFWRRATPWGGFWGLASGTFAAVAVHFLHSRGPLDLGSPLAADFWGAGAAFVVDVVVTVAVSLATQPNPTTSSAAWSGASPRPKRPRPATGFAGSPPSSTSAW